MSSIEMVNESYVVSRSLHCGGGGGGDDDDDENAG